MDDYEQKINDQRFLIDTQKAVIVKLENDKRQLSKSAEKLLKHIHGDIFYKEPRGQPSIGQDVRWRRCKDLLDAADKLREILES